MRSSFLKSAHSGEHLVPAYLFERYHQGQQQLFIHNTHMIPGHTPVYAGQPFSCESKHEPVHVSVRDSASIKGLSFKKRFSSAESDRQRTCVFVNRHTLVVFKLNHFLDCHLLLVF